jgi:hypothetical protein
MFPNSIPPVPSNPNSADIVNFSCTHGLSTELEAIITLYMYPCFSVNTWLMPWLIPYIYV